MMLVDEILYDPFCIVFFYTVIGLFNREPISQIIATIRSEYWTTQLSSWKLWPIVQIVNFAVVPSQLRLLFMNVFSFVWSIYLQLRVNPQKK